MASVQDIKINPPHNRLVGGLPKIGIRPAIDGRMRGVRESLEEQTMNMAKSVAALLTANLRHANGLPVEVVIADSCIGGVAEAAATAEKFAREGAVRLSWDRKSFALFQVHDDLVAVKTVVTRHAADGSAIKTWNCSYTLRLVGQHWLFTLLTSDDAGNAQVVC